MSPVVAEWNVVEKSDAVVADFGLRILELAQPPRWIAERRSEKRAPFPHLIELTPIDDTAIRITGEAVTVVGKQLASRGLDFYHTEMLPFKRAIVSFDACLGLDEHFVLNLSWCRFLRPGWYDSGGRFTHVVEPTNLFQSSDERLIV